MKIALLNCEPKYTNIALEKVRLYYAQKGAIVEDYFPLSHNEYDEIWASSIFDFTKKPDLLPGNIKCGGTGYDITSRLPAEIEAMNPKINIGFTSRGCNRNCKFCVVPRKEGKAIATGDIYDIWDGQSKDITLLDNNIFFLPGHFRKIAEQIIKENIRVDFNQGLDIRLLDDNFAALMARMKHKEYRFAFDSVFSECSVLKGIQILKNHGIKRSTFYILAGYDSPLEDALYRANVLRREGQNGYIMRFNGDRQYIPLARWVNQHHIFHGMTFEEFKKREYAA